MNQNKFIIFYKKLINGKAGLMILLSFMLYGSVDLYCQNMIVSDGTTVVCAGGKEVIESNLINDGNFNNNNNVIVFNGSVQSLSGNIPVSFESISVETGSTTNISSPGHTLKSILLCNGTLNANGNITLLSTPAGTALIDGSGTGQVLGDVTMERYLPSGFGYKYFSSPFQDATVMELGDVISLSDSFPVIYAYNENRLSSGWASYRNPSNVLIPLQGYSLNFGSSHEPVTADMTGVVNNGGLNATLYNHNNAFTKGFNLIGNPYPSPIDWDAAAGWTKTNIDNSLYYFRADSADQYGGVYSTYLNGISSDGLATNIIPSMQGFFIHVSDGTWPVTGSLALNNTVRLNNLTLPFAKSALSASPPYVRLSAGYSDDTLSFDPVCIYIDPRATYNFDSQYDALKLFNTDGNVTNLYAFGNDGSLLSIDAMPLSDTGAYTVRLGLKTERTGEVIFRINNINGDFFYNKIVLTDLEKGISLDLSNNDQYMVNLPAGNFQNRFYLNLSNTITGVPEEVQDKSWVNIYAWHGIVKAEINIPSFREGTIEIYNLLGEVIYISKIYQPGYHEFNPGLKAGLYIVNITSGRSRYSKKVFSQGQ